MVRSIAFRQRKLEATLPTLASIASRSQELSFNGCINRTLTTNEAAEWRKHVGEDQRKKRFDLDSEDQSIEQFHTDDTRVFEDLTIDKYQELIKSDGDRELVEEILNDYEYAKYTSFSCPSHNQCFQR